MGHGATLGKREEDLLGLVGEDGHSHWSGQSKGQDNVGRMSLTVLGRGTRTCLYVDTPDISRPSCLWAGTFHPWNPSSLWNFEQEYITDLEGTMNV